MMNCREMPKVYIRYGESGLGKTKWVEDTFGKNAHYLMPVGNPSKRFYGNYDRHTIVLYNEFTEHKFSLTEFCNTFDHQGPEVETKGGYTKFKPLHVILTSNRNPAQWWNDGTSHPEWPAFKRRIFCCKHVYKLDGVQREECDWDFCQHARVSEEEVRAQDLSSQVQEERLDVRPEEADVRTELQEVSVREGGEESYLENGRTEA